MIKNVSLTILISLTIVNSIRAQENLVNIEAKDLVDLTIDTSSVHAMREVISSDLLSIERKGFKRAYDSIAKVFEDRLEYYYKEQYTKEELKQFLVFCKTKTGKRFAADMGRLYQGNLTEDKPLYQRLSELKKKFRDWQPANEKVIVQNRAGADSLLRLLQTQKYLNIIKANKVMQIEPRFEMDYVKAFDRMSDGYLADLKQYFRDNYTDVEFVEIFQFYATPVGKKVIVSTGPLIAATIKADHEFVDNVFRIHKDINFGKFQREYFRENKE
ncbi:DUF2059 domain-containing protein [Flavobacterium sp. MFBS3-15]|uniref:DUF2059 domain-containing protein n=1 Tax=Flavobacterium sp. MFBS3-15 TaxID=2989816 RepID=UPI0022356A8C|nr:DUF2059 domain-containing protein [Flavobacterium sp. MFBS3-15]MCW4469422.1 DUF2059 domain-containing protein [Flavobacterium sp. MFBS3-15]